MIILQGVSGFGKSELVAQLCPKLINLSESKLNVIILNCESCDALTVSLYQVLTKMQQILN